MMFIDNKYDIGDIVYLSTDQDQAPRLVVCICISAHGLTYDLACGSASTSHYEIELIKEKNVLMTTSN